MHTQRHGLVEKQPLIGFHLWTDLEELVVSDQLLGHDLEELLPGNLDVFGIESKGGVVADLLLVVKELVVTVDTSIDEVAEIFDIEGYLFSLFL